MIQLDLGPVDGESPAQLRRFEVRCRFGKVPAVAFLTMTASPLGTTLEAEVKRLSPLVSNAIRQGLVVALLTDS